MRADWHAGHCRLVFLTRGRRALCLCTRPSWRRRKPEHHRPDARAKASRPDGARRDGTRGGAHRGWDGGPHHVSPAPRRRCGRTHRCVLRQQDARDVRCSRRRGRRRGRQHAEEQGVPERMLSAFVGSTGALGGRLLAAMRAGLAAGGEEGPVHSSGLLIVRDVSWPVANLRVDWSDADPIADLERLWALYEPQLEAYVTRAIDPIGRSELRCSGGRVGSQYPYRGRSRFGSVEHEAQRP